MGISIFKRNNSPKEQLDVSSTHNLWDLLRARYDSIEATQMLRNFVHDKDLDILLGMFLKHFQTQTEQLEKEAKNFKIKVPSRPVIDIKTSTNIDEITDKFIYKRVYADMLAEMLSLNSSVRTTLTNDRLRSTFKSYLLSHVSDFELLYKYGKLKGWEEVAPAYKTTKPAEKELISTSEAYHIWRNISDRYIQSQLTDFFLGFAHDLEFKAILKEGAKVISKQLKLIESKALNFEVQLPERPPSSLVTPIDPENLEDRFMYQIIFKGIDDSIDLHLRAIIATLRNDPLRKIFLNLYNEELNIHDNFIKYGKMKGWALVPPIYIEPN
ncbi:MAG: DUF3231 family protein [Firmicutes bacterium]|nr:DUF3231 family protein [Bacillota bacterium]